MRIMSIVIILGLSVSTSVVLRPQTPDQNTETVQTEIRSILELQEKAWNDGDLKGYMATYWESDELTFQSGGDRVKGWNLMLSRYETHYPPEKRGRLQFTDLEIRSICEDYAYVLGRWALDLRDSTRRSGLFTLLFRRMPQGWRIILDHTS